MKDAIEYALGSAVAQAIGFSVPAGLGPRGVLYTPPVVIPPADPPVIDSFTLSTISASTQRFDLEVSEASTIYYIARLAGTPASSTNIQNGLNAAGSPAVVNGSFSLVGAGSHTVTFPADTFGDFYFDIVAVGEDDEVSGVSTTGPVAIDTRPPASAYDEDFDTAPFERDYAGYDMYAYAETPAGDSFTITQEAAAAVPAQLPGASAGRIYVDGTGNNWWRILIPQAEVEDGDTVEVRSSFSNGTSTSRTGRALMIWLNADYTGASGVFNDTSDVSGGFTQALYNGAQTVSAKPSGIDAGGFLAVYHRVNTGTISLYKLRISNA